tara:strand:+ start:857 stop:1270 length:414 start_codon:yes stop_codon:yes gene_type:complete
MTVNKIKIFKNKIKKNKKGNLVKFVSKKNIFFNKFGEIYFNHIKFKKTKGWNKHKKNNCLIQCIYGKIKFHLIDSEGNERKIVLKSNSGKILKIPPKVWFSFQSLSNNSIIANMIENCHSDKEVTKTTKVLKYEIKP